MARPVGAILAGGRAARLGGVDKGLLVVGGQPILARVAAVLARGCAPLVLNANGEAARFASFGLPVVPDDVGDYPGPLAGILAALDWAASHEGAATHVVTAPADTPFLPDDLVARLDQVRMLAGAEIACARSGGARHPVVAIWPVALRCDLREALVDRGIRKVGQYLSTRSVAAADWDAEPIDPFFNVNTADDFARAAAVVGAARG